MSRLAEEQGIVYLSKREMDYLFSAFFSMTQGFPRARFPWAHVGQWTGFLAVRTFDWWDHPPPVDDPFRGGWSFQAENMWRSGHELQHADVGEEIDNLADVMFWLLAGGEDVRESP